VIKRNQNSVVASKVTSIFQFLLKVGVEESIVNVPWIMDHGSAVLISLFALFVFLLCRLTSGKKKSKNVAWSKNLIKY
jgi:hypothetical protein